MTDLERWQPYPEYRHSGVEWLGDIPAHWEIKRLKTMVSIRPSNVDKKSSEDDIPVRLCNYTDVYYNDFVTADMDLMAATATLEQIRRFELKAGDLIITKDSETADDIAIAAYVPRDLPGIVCGYHLALLRPLNNSIVGRYLFRAFAANPLSSQFEIAAHGITRYGLSTAAIADAFFLYPPPDEQQAIADFLDRETIRIDELILKKQQLCILLREKIIAQTTVLVTRGLDSSAPMTETGINWLPNAPAHWRIQRIASIYQETHELGEEGFPILSVSINWGISDRQLDDEDRHRMVNHIEDKTQYKRVRPGDLVYNMMRAWQGAFGVTAIDGLVSPAYVVARPTQTIYSPYFESLLRTPMCIEEFRRASKGIADFRQRLYWEHFRQVVVVLPPFEEQQAIANKVKEETRKIEKLIGTITQSIERLQEFRSALITAAVTGQFDVTAWDKHGMTDQTIDTIEAKTAVR